MKPYTNALTLSHRGKGIPYGGTGEVREDGDANFGFRDLKGQPEMHEEIPELQRDPALARLVCSINASNTGLPSSAVRRRNFAFRFGTRQQSQQLGGDLVPDSE